MSRRVQAAPRDRVESGSRRTVALPVDWPARREAVKKRDKTCRWIEHGQLCRSTENVEVDHVGSPEDHDLTNLRLLCRPHHSRRTGQQGAAAAKQYYATRTRRRPADEHPGLL